MTHEDERRILTSMPYREGELKVIVAKEDCELGGHYHKIKNEEFTMIKGVGTARVGDQEFMLRPGHTFTVMHGTPHSFKLTKNSVLFCYCSHPYDKSDDYEIK